MVEEAIINDLVPYLQEYNITKILTLSPDDAHCDSPTEQATTDIDHGPVTNATFALSSIAQPRSYNRHVGRIFPPARPSADNIFSSAHPKHQRPFSTKTPRSHLAPLFELTGPRQSTLHAKSC
jgi:hypothetical protein